MNTKRRVNENTRPDCLRGLFRNQRRQVARDRRASAALAGPGRADPPGLASGGRRPSPRSGGGPRTWPERLSGTRVRSGRARSRKASLTAGTSSRLATIHSPGRARGGRRRMAACLRQGLSSATLTRSTMRGSMRSRTDWPSSHGHRNENWIFYCGGACDFLRTLFAETGWTGTRLKFLLSHPPVIDSPTKKARLNEQS
jgi:hypothetical protein